MSTYRTKRITKASGRRFNSIATSDEKLSIDRRVYLPFDLAMVHAAAQNFRIELAKGTHLYLDEWENYKPAYMSEALEYLQDDGCNLYPGHNSEFWICVDDSMGFIPMPSPRAVALTSLFDGWFFLNDVDRLKDIDFPCPSKINSPFALTKAINNFNRRFTYD